MTMHSRYGHEHPIEPPWPAPAEHTDRGYGTPDDPATEEPPPPVYGAVVPYGTPYPPHGQWLVPFPDAADDVRSTPPAWWPVVVCTALFGLFGAIPAGRRARRARRVGSGVAPYWVSFGVTLVVNTLVVAVVLAVAVPVYLGVRESARVEVLQENLVTDGRLVAGTGVIATEARCRATAQPASESLRTYACVVTLTDGRTATLTVTADPEGGWSLAPAP